MKKISFDYLFKTSPDLLFTRINTPNGLSEWFADEVIVNENIFTFKWKNSKQQAKHTSDIKKLRVKFDWTEDEKYTEFKIEKSKLTNELSLIITDLVDEDEDVQDAKSLWDNQIDKLKKKLGDNGIY